MLSLGKVFLSRADREGWLLHELWLELRVMELLTQDSSVALGESEVFIISDTRWHLQPVC